MPDTDRRTQVDRDAAHAKALAAIDGFVGAPPAPKREITGVADRFAALDNFLRVFAIRPGDRVLMLVDPLLDRARDRRGHGPRDGARRRRCRGVHGDPTRKAPSIPDRGQAAARSRRLRRLDLVLLDPGSVLHRRCAASGPALGQDHLLPQPRPAAHAAGALPDRPRRRDRAARPRSAIPRGATSTCASPTARGTRLHDPVHRRTMRDNHARHQPLARADVRRRAGLLRPLPADARAQSLGPATAVQQRHQRARSPMRRRARAAVGVGFARPFAERIAVEFEGDTRRRRGARRLGRRAHPARDARRRHADRRRRLRLQSRRRRGTRSIRRARTRRARCTSASTSRSRPTTSARVDARLGGAAGAPWTS